jgi:hypothetical protein
VYCCIALEIGKPLDALLDEWTGFQRSMSSTRQEALLRLSFAAVQTIRHLMGETEDPLNSKDDIYDFEEAAAFTKRAGATKAHVALRMWQMRLAYIFNDYVLASQCALLREFFRMPGGFLTPSVSFFGALVCLAAVRDGRDRRSNLNLAREILGRFRNWALASPENCGGRKMLIEAELASVMGLDELAYEKYIYAIALFRDQPGQHALANERLARHLQCLDQTERCIPFFKVALASYYSWGATGKAGRLEEEIGMMLV